MPRFNPTLGLILTYFLFGRGGDNGGFNPTLGLILTYVGVLIKERRDLVSILP